jgi:hypothetical protein
MTGVVGALLKWLGGGSALAALVSVLLAVSALVLGLTYRRYLGILGADRRRPAERQAYDALRDSLAHGVNAAARIYAERLTAFLDRVDRFFDDAGMADRTLFPHAFGLRTPAPLWTAPAFDRCLLLALIYPIVTIFVIWTVSGHVGPAEAALHLKPDLADWRRGLAAAGIWFRSSQHGAVRKQRDGSPLRGLLALALALALFRSLPVALCLSLSLSLLLLLALPSSRSSALALSTSKALWLWLSLSLSVLLALPLSVWPSVALLLSLSVALSLSLSLSGSFC